jgi:hypothetical protein
LEEAPTSIFRAEESQAEKKVHDMGNRDGAVSEPMAATGPTERLK